MSDSPTYYLFLKGDLCPSWIERIVPPTQRVYVYFTADTEAVRHADHVEIRPLFPLTDEHPHFLRINNMSGRHVVIQGAPTTVIGTSRHFPEIPPLQCEPGPDDHIIDCDDDAGEEWKR